jgi:hypothetical protein
MCNVIDQSRKERCNPWAWRSTKSSHDLITPYSEVARCSGNLLLIALHTCAEERGRGTTSPTSGNASTNLASGVSGVAGRCGGHDAECGPINLTACRLTLCTCNGTVKGTNLLDGGDSGPWSTPRFQQCRHVVVIGNRQQQFAHSPEWIWRIGERIAANRFNSRANLCTPLSSKRRCDGGENAEICSQLQGPRRTTSVEDPIQLGADSLAREARR